MFAQNTRADMIRFLRRFYLWMIEDGYSTIPALKVKKIRSPPYERMRKTAEHLLTEEEVRDMIDACRTSRDRALISVLYESACRIGELAALRWQDVTFTADQTAAINTAGKTGKPRYIPLVSSRSYLAAWKQDYPGSHDNSSFVFLTANTARPLQYAGVVKQIQKIAKRAGVEKHVTPHIFRHSRITHLLRKGVPEAVIKKLAWGSLSTDMLQTYAHLVATDIDTAILQTYGIRDLATVKKSDAMEPKQCPHCYSVWGPGVTFCGSCGLPLTTEADAQVTELKTMLANIPAEQLVKIMMAALSIYPVKSQ